MPDCAGPCREPSVDSRRRPVRVRLRSRCGLCIWPTVPHATGPTAPAHRRFHTSVRAAIPPDYPQDASPACITAYDATGHRHTSTDPHPGPDFEAVPFADRAAEIRHRAQNFQQASTTRSNPQNHAPHASPKTPQPSADDDLVDPGAAGSSSRSLSGTACEQAALLWCHRRVRVCLCPAVRPSLKPMPPPGRTSTP